MIYWILYYNDGTCISELDKHWDDVSKMDVKSIALILPLPNSPVIMDIAPAETPFQKKTGQIRFKLSNLLDTIQTETTSHIIGKKTKKGKVYYEVDALTYKAELKVE